MSEAFLAGGGGGGAPGGGGGQTPGGRSPRGARSVPGTMRKF